MTPLIDQIEQAFIVGREQWKTEDSVSIDALTDTLRTNGIEDADGALTKAFLDARRVWGNDWHYQTGDVAEWICAWLITDGHVNAHASQPC